MTIDLTVGNPGTVLWSFCLLLFGSVIFQQMYNIADSLIAGKFVGETSVAGDWERCCLCDRKADAADCGSQNSRCAGSGSKAKRSGCTGLFKRLLSRFIKLRQQHIHMGSGKIIKECLL